MNKDDFISVTSIEGTAHSRLSKFVDAIRDDKVLDFYRSTSGEKRFLWEKYIGTCEASATKFSQFVPIMIMHDWESELGDGIKNMPGDEWKLPFERVAFEFVTVQNAPSCGDVRIPAIMFIQQNEDFTIDVFVAFQNVVKAWSFTSVHHREPLHTFFQKTREFIGPNAVTSTRGYLYAKMMDFIRAACIAIDTGIAETEKVSIAPKLQAKRARHGKSPLPDFRIINLSLPYRERAAARSEATEPARRVRLHFRRGHWWPRLGNDDCKMAAFRKWRPWKLVGDPDLGYIKHQYRI